LKVKNTTQGYVKFRLVSVPEDIQSKITISLWATTVSGKSMRPAKDKEGNILLPLERSAEENILTIELFYLYSNMTLQIMKKSGSIDLYSQHSTPQLLELVIHCIYQRILTMENLKEISKISNTLVRLQQYCINCQLMSKLELHSKLKSSVSVKLS
jgi:hypothetical protein